MAGKLQMVTQLYQKAIKEVASSPANWTNFLVSACRNYRLPFDEQLLVYVQRPEATAVLEIEGWNERFGRWVKKGAKGIAVLNKSGEKMQLKYYFDISDTQESRYSSLVRPVPMWKVRIEDREEVQETIANAKKEVEKPFSKEEELQKKSKRLEELNALLSMDEPTILGEEEQKTEREVER